MHKLALAAALQSAYSLLLADALPAPSPVSTLRLHDAGGMAPWLRLALGDEAARDLEACKVANYHIAALLGVGDDGRNGRHQALEADPAHVVGIQIVDAVAEHHGSSPVWSFAFCVRQRVADRREAARLLQGVVDLDGLMLPDLFEPKRADVLRAIARRNGIELRDEPADLSAWKDAELDVVVTARYPATHYRYGGIMEEEHVDCRAADGHEWTIHAGRLLTSPVPQVGTRLRLMTRGSTSGHRGYVARIVDLQVQEQMEEIRTYLAAAEEARLRAEAFDALRTLDSQGRLVAEGDEVVLERGCLEADEGARGVVVEVLGDMALVKFQRRRKSVPCYGEAIRVLVPEAA